VVTSFVESVPVIPDMLVGAGLGALVGAAVAQRHQRLGGSLPFDWVVARWTLAGAALLGSAALILELL
jgi:hypothetical protein